MMAWSISPVRRDGELGLFSPEKQQLGGISSVCTNIGREGVTRREPGGLEVVPSDRTKENRHKHGAQM